MSSLQMAGSGTKNWTSGMEGLKFRVMRIDWLITEMNTIGGAETYVRKVVPHLRRNGYDVRVISLMPGGILLNELKSEGIPVVELGVKKKFDLRVIWKLWRLWSSEKPGIVHTHLYHAGIIGRLIARLVGIRTIIVHQHGAESARSPIRSMLDYITSPMVTQYVATCLSVSEIMQKREGISQDKITIIYNGIELFDEVKPEIHSINQKAEKKIKIINIGRLSEEKGQATLLEAFAQLAMKYDNLQLVLIGDGKLLNSITTRSVKPDLAGKVMILGYRRDIIDQLRNADIFVLPSHWEGVSMALLEAMAVGLPVVATAVGGTPEVVIDGETGLLIPPFDVDALKTSLAYLIDHRDIRRSMGRSGHQRITDHFLLDHTIRQLQILYEKYTTE